MNKLPIKITGIIALLFIFSCKTYTISPESFREQMMNSTSKTLKEVTINNPLIPGNITYDSNNMNRLIVKDKEGIRWYLDNTPAIEMRVTHSNGKKYHFYFDTVLLENDTLKGGRSRFINATRQIPMDSIVKIEVQDGRKNFKYKNK